MDVLPVPHSPTRTIWYELVGKSRSCWSNWKDSSAREGNIGYDWSIEGINSYNRNQVTIIFQIDHFSTSILIIVILQRWVSTIAKIIEYEDIEKNSHMINAIISAIDIFTFVNWCVSGKWRFFGFGRCTYNFYFKFLILLILWLFSLFNYWFIS